MTSVGAMSGRAGVQVRMGGLMSRWGGWVDGLELFQGAGLGRSRGWRLEGREVRSDMSQPW